MEADDGGEDFRRGGEGGRGEGEEEVGLGVHLRGGGEEAIVADSGCGGDSFCDFTLHHEDGAADGAGAGGCKEVEEDV